MRLCGATAGEFVARRVARRELIARVGEQLRGVARGVRPFRVRAAAWMMIPDFLHECGVSTPLLEDVVLWLF